MTRPSLLVTRSCDLPRVVTEGKTRMPWWWVEPFLCGVAAGAGALAMLWLWWR